MSEDRGRADFTVSLPSAVRHPLLLFLLAYLSGLCIFFPTTRFFIAPYFLPLSLFLLALFILHYQTRKTTSQYILIFFLAGLGYLAPLLPDITRPSNHILNQIQEGQSTSVQGKIFAPPRILKDRTYYRLQLESLGTPPVATSGTVRVSVYKPHVPFKSGDRVRLHKIRLKIPRNFKNPGRFDYHHYLKWQGIDVTGNISRPETMEPLGQFDLPTWQAGLQKFRNQLVHSIEKLFPGEAGNLLKAMVLGMKDSLSPQVRDNYIATGLAHLMAVSGLHIGFVAAASYFILWPILFYGLFRLKPNSARAGHARKLTAFLCLIPILFYMLVVGPKISSLRAGIMVSALLMVILVDRQSSLFNVFLTAGFAILLWKPESLLDAGFQLSFLAVGGILVVFTLLSQVNDNLIAKMGEPSWSQKLMRSTPSTPGMQESFSRKLLFRFEKIFLAGALVSVTVTAATLPVLAYQFNQISLVGVVLNIFMVPLASILIPTVLLLTLIGVASTTLASLFTAPVMGVAQLFLWVPEFFANYPLASLTVPTPPVTWLIWYFLALFSGLLILKSRAQNKPIRKRWGLGFAVAALFTGVLLCWPKIFQLPHDNLVISVLDVGQGESLCIEFPNGQTLIMDGGGFYKNRLDVGKRVVAPFLWKQGIRDIDYMVATHSDNDHIRGLHALLDLFPVKNFLTLGENSVGWRLRNLEKKAHEKGAELLALNRHQPITIGEVRLIPLHPGVPPTTDSKRRIDNDLSLVLRLEYKKFSMLFTADIGEKIETILAQTPEQLKADILKGPHHGSRFSNSLNFIEAVDPDTVIFSSGYLNRMHHPHPETLERYRKASVEIKRTDLNGAVQIITNGNGYEIRTHENL